jgi:hypothetical protein
MPPGPRIFELRGLPVADNLVKYGLPAYRNIGLRVSDKFSAIERVIWSAGMTLV